MMSNELDAQILRRREERLNTSEIRKHTCIKTYMTLLNLMNKGTRLKCRAEIPDVNIVQSVVSAL